jgi:TolB-like protein/Tfp pilus assembly protein PilF
MASEEQGRPQSDGAAAVVERPSPSPSSSGSADIWSKIKRHKVVEWSLAYVAFGYAALHASQMLRETFEWSLVVPRLTFFALLLGFPIAVTLAWYQGHRAQHRASRVEIGILAALLLIAGSALWFVSRYSHERDASSPAVTALPSFAPPLHSVAVLPFTNLSGDPKEEYFSEGMTEELINALSQINSLEVIARTSSFSFKGQNLDIGTIARKLNVGAVLEGSIRRSGNTVRVTTQLINAVSGFHMWSQDYDRKLTDILKVQTDVATSVAQQLEVKLVGDEATKIEVGGTKNSEAYDAYLRGVQLLALAAEQQSPEGYPAALKAFGQAIALDPNYATAYAGLAETDIDLTFGGPNIMTRPDLRRAAGSAAERAVALAPELGETHLALAEVQMYEFLNMGQAAPEFDRALALAPGSARVQRGFAFFASRLRHVKSALKAARQAVDLDPQNPSSYQCLARVLHDARRYDEELEILDHARVLYRDSDEVGAATAGNLLVSGKSDRAREFCESPSTPMVQWGRHYCLALAYHALGRPLEAERHLKLFMALGRNSDAIPYAGIYALWGNKTAALQWLVTAERRGDPDLTTIKVDEELDPIRNEPEFKAIEARMNFPP